jgi:hypothetical protein
MSEHSSGVAKSVQIALEGLNGSWLEQALRAIAKEGGLGVERGTNFNFFFIGVNHLGDLMAKKEERGDRITDRSTGPTMAKSLGAGSKAESHGDLIQQAGLTTKDLAHLASLFVELAKLLNEAQVPNRKKLEEAVVTLGEAKAATESPTPDKGRIAAAWDHVRGWVTSALAAGLFVESTAEQVSELVSRIGRLIY